MDKKLQNIEHGIALLVRLTTAISPKLGELDRSEYLLLSNLDNNSPVAINVMADKLKLNVSTASRQIATLESKGFIKRFPAKKNARTSMIEITAIGTGILRRVQQARIAAYSEILHEWSQEELANLETSLERLNTSLMRWNKE